MGRIRDDATSSIAKIDTFRELEELFSSDGRKIIAKALMLYWDTNYDKDWPEEGYMDLKTKERIKSLMDNIFDVWYETRLSLDLRGWDNSIKSI